MIHRASDFDHDICINSQTGILVTRVVPSLKTRHPETLLFSLFKCQVRTSFYPCHNMKFVAFFVVLLIFVDLSVQIPKLVNCPADFVLSESMKNGCGVLTCTGRHSISGVGCGQWQCQEGKQLSYIHADNSKLYPDCCSGPVCAE